MSELRSALIVAVPEAAAAVDDWRERTCHAKPSTGVPAHVTILWPFVPATRIDRALLADLRSLFATVAPFAFELRTTARFPETLYLTPEPAALFIRLTRAVCEAYPDYPPYEGMFEAIVPHLTTAQGDHAVLAAAEADVLPWLPILARTHDVLFIEEVEPDGARWRPHASFPLGNG